jgi:hypothetical protein
MRGPANVYAVNGHERNYSATTDDGKKYIGGFTIFSNAIVGKVAGVHVEFPRSTAAQILKAWRADGHTIGLEMYHTNAAALPSGPDTCAMCAGTDVRIVPHPAFATS